MNDMGSVYDDARRNLKRRLHGAMRTIDESLLLHHQRNGVKPHPRCEDNNPNATHEYNLMPHVSSLMELRAEQRWRELQAEREEAERLLETLKRAREMRGRNSSVSAHDCSSDLLVGRDTYSKGEGSSRTPKQGRQEEQEEFEPSELCLTRSPAPVAPDVTMMPMQSKENEVPKVVDRSIEILEENVRQRLTERRASEERRLEKLRAMRHSALVARRRALEEAQAQIEQAEAERLERLLQIEQNLQRDVEEAQDRSILTKEEVHAMTVHKRELESLRARTGIGVLQQSIIPPTSPVCHSTTHASSLHHTAARLIKGARRSTTPPDQTLSDFSPSVSAREFTPTSPDEPLGTSPPASHRAIKLNEKADIPLHLQVSTNRCLENMMKAASSSLSASESASSGIAFLDGKTIKKEAPREESSVRASSARHLISPSFNSSGRPSNENTSIVVLASQALAVMQHVGIEANVIPTKGVSIPTLLRFSVEQGELLMHVQRYGGSGGKLLQKSPMRSAERSATNSFLVPPSFRSSRSPTPTCSSLQQRQQLVPGVTVPCGVCCLWEVHHFLLSHCFSLCPYGVLGTRTSGDVGKVLCGAKARRLLIELSCTLFAHTSASPYFVFLVSNGTSTSDGRAATQSISLGTADNAMLLVLRFRNRREWIIFLMAKEQLQSSTGISISYGRALWMLTAQLLFFRRPRGGALITTTLANSRHIRMLPRSVLSFSPEARRMPMPSVTGEHGRAACVHNAPRRFLIPPESGCVERGRSNNWDSADSSCAVPRETRGRRFGLPFCSA